MSENLKELVLKNGKIVVEDKAKDLRIRKNYSLPQQTISDIEELAKTLNCSASEAIVEAIKVVNSLLVVEEEPKAPKKRTTKKAIKQETKENEIMALLERHKKLDDDTNGEDRAVNEYAINQGFGNIINIYNIKNERVYFHTVKQLEGITYTRIYCRGEY